MSLAVVDPSSVEFGLSLPPHGPHTITTHAPGWHAAERFRDRDASLFAQLKSIYPRFMPFGLAGTVSNDQYVACLHMKPAPFKYLGMVRIIAILI